MKYKKNKPYNRNKQSAQLGGDFLNIEHYQYRPPPPTLDAEASEQAMTVPVDIGGEGVIADKLYLGGMIGGSSMMSTASDIQKVIMLDPIKRPITPEQAQAAADAAAADAASTAAAAAASTAAAAAATVAAANLQSDRDKRQLLEEKTTRTYIIKKRKDDKLKKKNEGLIKFIRKLYEECVKKIDNINIAKRIFMKKLDEEITDPKKIELNIKRQALFEAIDKKATDIDIEIHNLNDISGNEEKIEIKKQIEKEEDRIKVKERIAESNTEELRDIREKIRTTKNELEENEKKKIKYPPEILSNKKIMKTKGDDITAKEERLRQEPNIDKYEKSTLWSEIRSLRTARSTLEIDTDALENEVGKLDAKIAASKYEIDNLIDKERTLNSKLGISNVRASRGGARAIADNRRNPSSEYSILLNNPENNLKKLKEIKYNVEAICIEIDNKFKVIKSADSEFDKILKNEELEKQRIEEEETKKKEELDKETETEIEEVQVEAIKETTPEVVKEAIKEIPEVIDKIEVVPDEEIKIDDSNEIKIDDSNEIKIDDSNEINTLRKQIEDQKISYERINDMLKALINVLEEKYLNKNQEKNTVTL